MTIKLFWIEKLNSDFGCGGGCGVGGSDGDGDDDDDDAGDDDDDDGDGDDDDDNTAAAAGWWSWQDRNKPCMWFIILEGHPLWGILSCNITFLHVDSFGIRLLFQVPCVWKM